MQKLISSIFSFEYAGELRIFKLKRKRGKNPYDTHPCIWDYIHALFFQQIWPWPWNWNTCWFPTVNYSNSSLLLGFHKQKWLAYEQCKIDCLSHYLKRLIVYLISWNRGWIWCWILWLTTSTCALNTWCFDSFF